MILFYGLVCFTFYDWYWYNAERKRIDRINRS